MAHLVYTEKQHYLTKKHFHLALVLELFLILSIAYQISARPTLAPMALFLLAAVLIFLTALLWFLNRLSLKVSVTTKGISFKMAPFQLKKRKLKWAQIAHCKIISDPNLLSWNVGLESSWQEKKFTFTARHGISLITVHGERLFIGSPNLTKLQDAIEEGVANYRANHTP
jgi:hypothetical protein